MTILGYAEYGPGDGIGPFKDIFDSGERLLTRGSLEGLSAIVLWGGEDISPTLYDQTPIPNSGPKMPTSRDLFEWELIRQAVKADIPIIGVCRGAQMLCAYAGGKLIQNVTGHHGHHGITCHDGETFQVSSVHHQMLYPYDVEHELLAWSTQKRSTIYEPEGSYMEKHMLEPAFEEPEVVYFPTIKGFAIQCHPEWHYNADTLKFNKWVLNEFLNQCYSKTEC